MKTTNEKQRKSKDRVLIVEDDRSLREGLAMNLRLNGYDTHAASDGEAGMQMAFDTKPDLIILDIMLPCWSGLEILEALRQRNNHVPVLILSARGTAPDKVEGLTLGADDYMAKPFDLPELLARVSAMLRRRHTELQSLPSIHFGNIAIDRAARTVHIQDEPVPLSAREFDLLCLLAAAPGKVFTRDAILEQVWGWDYEGTARTVDNFVANLRKKLQPTPQSPQHIHTVPRVGYRLDT
jgi:two-component system, OmpR family, alkaline phosphatase synthesis response regulator PhoP